MRGWICCWVQVRKNSTTLFVGIIFAALLILGVNFHTRYLVQTNSYQGVSNRVRFNPLTSQSSELTPRQEILDVHSPQRNMSETVKSFRSCQPKRNVMFLKTHKTASSTILNLLYRFGEKHGLTFALPTHYQFGYPILFSSRRVKGFLQRDVPHYNIMCNHMRFNRPEVQKVMPADTFYFSILRNPVALAESSYSYYKSVAPSFKRSVNFDAFIANPWRYYLPQVHNNHYARNLLWFDFGFNHNANFSLQVAQAGVEEIQQSFHLILLAEYFDQSMVLLRDALCWSLDDIVTFRLNFRSNDTRRRLSAKQEERLKQWNAMDWYLYQSFNKTFWQRVERFGKSRMDQEVAILQARQKELMDLCLLQGGKPAEASQILDRGVRPFQFGQAKILGYNLNLNLSLSNKERCLRMIMPELQYKDLLDSKQFPRAEGVPKQALAKEGIRPQSNVHLGASGSVVNKRDHVIQKIDLSKQKLRRSP
ncbi:galactose-3-O-sulfotransferase 4 isoform X2 [Erpetoichthys calabaricus]|nr:galactose-3-O-sulfotransferase 4 isoform X2 [Erpetoichthys calabaricus]XP_051780041.1 galactose-3-O-sulfotransferase 4 isoform X2 [Erpetoichthys calabaricus]XP_051780042.1 galactose-3-O-sulfotransferase 4 isoform X2 [Erpetoichthys calabaricus]